jgi:hypothetical protein
MKVTKATRCTPVININTPLFKKTMQAPDASMVIVGNTPIDKERANLEGNMQSEDQDKISMFGFYFEGDPNSSEKDVIGMAANRRYALSSVPALLKHLTSFPRLYFEAVPVSEMQYGLENKVIPSYKNILPAFTMGNTGYSMVLKGEKDGRSQVLAILPRDSTALTSHMYEKMRDNMRNGVFAQPINAKTLMKFISNTDGITKPGIMDKEMTRLFKRDESQLSTYSLADLKQRYGDHYKYHFSSMYVLTDNNDSRYHDDKKGRPMIFYSKNPDGKHTVDDLITSRMVGADQLAPLWLDEDVMYRSVDELAESFYKTENGKKVMYLPKSNNETRLFLGPWFVKELYPYFMQHHTTFLERFGKDFQSIFDFIKDGISFVKDDDRSNYIASEMLRFVLKSYDKRSELHYKELFSYIDKLIMSNQKGVYISPAIVLNYLQDVSFAPVDIVDNKYREMLEKKLKLKNMALDPITVPSMNFSFTQSGIDELFHTAPMPVQSEITLPTAKETLLPGKVLHEDISLINQILGRHGITLGEISNVIHKKLLPLIQNQRDINSALNTLLDNYKC